MFASDDGSGSLALDVVSADAAVSSPRGSLGAGGDSWRGSGRPRAVLTAPSVLDTPIGSPVDWLVRVWPGVWLERAGFLMLGAELARRRVVNHATANEVIAMLRDHGAALRTARDEAWRPLRQRLFARDAESPELWGEVVDGTRRAASGAAAHRLRVAAAADGSSVADVHRVLGEVQAERLWRRIVSPRTDLPWPWPVLVDTVTHAAHVVAWAGVDQFDRDQPGLLDPADPPLGWGYAFDAAAAATARVVDRLDHVTAVNRADWAGFGRPVSSGG